MVDLTWVSLKVGTHAMSVRKMSDDDTLWEPMSCCSGSNCGCMGLPINPPLCDNCCVKQNQEGDMPEEKKDNRIKCLIDMEGLKQKLTDAFICREFMLHKNIQMAFADAIRDDAFAMYRSDAAFRANVDSIVAGVIRAVESNIDRLEEDDGVVDVVKILSGPPVMGDAKAPITDFDGNDIYEGDTIVHPSGQHGVVVFHRDREESSDAWCVDYGVGFESRLCLQVGAKGQGVVRFGGRS